MKNACFMRLFFLSIFLMNINFVYCQIDTLTAIEEEVFDSGFSNIIPVKDTLVHWYNHKTGIIVEKEDNDYFYVVLDSAGNRSSKSQVKIYLAHDTAWNFNSVSRDFITSVTVQHKFKTWRFGKHEAYNDAGKVIETGAYKYDLKNGKWKYFSDNGKLIKEEKWRLGILKKVINFKN
ncbi:MAG: hypothetical protein ACXWW0_04450 [Bacteroidia bacterium]